MDADAIVFMIFLIFAGAAVMATLVLYTRQSLLVAYILLGALLGPSGLGILFNQNLVSQIGEVGIIFLLFLLGLHLQPQNLLQMLRKVTWVALLSSVLFASIGFSVSYLFGFSVQESAIVGVAFMFSSTIIGLKLLPTTILHHQHTGEVMISVLLMQDLIAIIVLIVLNSLSQGSFTLKDVATILVALPSLILFSYVVERFVLVKLLARFDRTQEYVFLLSIGWCLSLAELANYLGLSEEIGAFLAGVALAASPIALYIAESLKPLRDFFLVMFFFSVGATFRFDYLDQVIIPATVLATLILFIKPITFKYLLYWAGETKKVSAEVGVRLGQGSEFSLLVATLSMTTLLSSRALYFIQATTILTFIVSSYIVVLRYPTPIALSENMRRD
jgi:Kef-type K+ transport system membrane component KefB